tara:strand:+ start:690 stop:1640 length:951 start_codon:yes stop_codon:yes gene_type:complete
MPVGADSRVWNRLGNYRLYFHQNQDFFSDASRDLVAFANFLKDMGDTRNLKGWGYQYGRFDNRWDQKGSAYHQDDISDLREVMMYQLDNMPSSPSRRNMVSWMNRVYLPNNFLGVLRLRLYSWRLSIKEFYRGIRDNYYSNDIDQLQNAISNSIKWYYRNRPKDRFREQYDPVLFQQALVEYQYLADVMTLFKEVYFRGQPGYPTSDEKPVPTPAMLNEALFELGMDDPLPEWDPRLCQRCDASGKVSTRAGIQRCSACRGFGYLGNPKLFPVLYPGSFPTSRVRTMNNDSRWPFTVEHEFPTSEQLAELAARAKL